MGIGMGAVSKTADRQASQGGGGDFLQSIYWQDKANSSEEDRQKIVRFLTDDIVTAKVYSFVKGGPKGKARDFISPYSLYDDEDGSPNFDWVPEARDYFEDNNILLPDFYGKPTPAEKYRKEQAYGLVVLREEVPNPDGNYPPTIIRDKIVHREYEKDGKVEVYNGPVYGYIKQGFPNFWTLLVGFYNRYHTLTDRDYVITRQGNDKNTKYHIVPCDKDQAPDLVTPDQLEERYDPPQTLEDLMKHLSDYEAAKNWFEAVPSEDGGDTREEKVSTGSSQSERGPSSSSSSEERVHPPEGGMRSKLQGYRKK